MVLAGLIAGAGLVDERAASEARKEQGPLRLIGQKLVEGMARGVAVFHQARVVVEHTVAEDVEAERHRVYSAFAKMREPIDRMMTQADFGTAGEPADQLETRTAETRGGKECVSHRGIRMRAYHNKITRKTQI